MGYSLSLVVTRNQWLILLVFFIFITVIIGKSKNAKIPRFPNMLNFSLASAMEQHALKKVNNCRNTNISFYSETSGGQSYVLYLNDIHYFNTSFNKTSVAA
jgi:hypothetical protein